MKVRIRKLMSAVISAAMVLTSISTVTFAANATQKVIIDDDFNNASLADPKVPGMNGAWKNMGYGWSNMEPEKRAEGDICWKWTKGYNLYDPLGSWEQMFVEMDALTANDTLNISYDLKLGTLSNTKSVVVLDGGTDNVEYIQLGEVSQGGIYHVGTTPWVDNNQATAGGDDIKRDEWVKVNITVKDSKTSISVDGTVLCKDIVPPAGRTFNQVGVNTVRFTADGINNTNGSVRIDNVKITVDSESGGETPETPDEPDKPSGDVLLSENFDSYTVGQTAKETIQPKGWHPWFSEDTSKIVKGADGHGNALEIINPDSNYIHFDYQNMNIEKTYGVTEMIFKSAENGILTIYFYKTGNNDKIYEININNLNINGTKLTDSWYKLIAVVDKVNGKIDWAITDMDGTSVVLGSEATEQLKDFNEIRIANFSNAVPVYVDEISVTQTDVKPTLPKLPPKTVLLSEDFESYTVGQTAKETIQQKGWHPFFSEDTSKIVEGAKGHGNALEIINPNWQNGIRFDYQNIDIEKTYGVTEMMFKSVKDGNFTFYFFKTGGSQIYEININKLNVNGTKLTDSWYKLFAVVDKTNGRIDWAITDMDGTAVAVGNENNDNLKDFNEIRIASFSTSVSLFVDEISVTQTDDKPTLPKLPPRKTLFEQNFNDYQAGKLFKEVKGDNNWGMFYSDDSVITTGADGYGNALQMKALSGNYTGSNINWNYKGIVPELDVVDFSIMFNTPADTNFDIFGSDGSGQMTIAHIEKCQIGKTNISADTWYKLNAEINRKTGKGNCKVTSLDDQEVYTASITAKDFCGFMLQSYPVNGEFKDILFDEIKVTQKCGAPKLMADGLAFYRENEKQTDIKAISTVTDKITLTFNTVMNLKSLTDNVKIKTGAAEVSYTAELDDKVFIMTLSEPLKPNTEYTIEIGDGVTAYTGETIEQALTESFKTTEGEMTGKIMSAETKGKTMNITISYINTSDTALNGYVIAAYFNGNKLIKVAYSAEITRAASVKSDTIKCSLTVPDFGSAEQYTSAKLMFWNGLDKMIPITEVYPIK